MKPKRDGRACRGLRERRGGGHHRVEQRQRRPWRRRPRRNVRRGSEVFVMNIESLLGLGRGRAGLLRHRIYALTRI